MIIHLRNNPGVMLTSLSSIAFAGLIGPSSHLLVSAQRLVCDITVDVFTWEDKTLPYKNIPLPSINVLKYGIPAVLDERFDLNAEDDTWLATDKFKSFQFKSAQPYNPGLDSNADSPSSFDSLDDQPDASAKDNLNSDDDSFSLNSFGAPSDSAAITASRLRSRSRSRSLQFMPKKCWTNHKCRAEYMKKYNSRIRMNGYIPNTKGMCRLCSVDDDFLLEDVHPREVTLDQLMGTATYDDYEENPLHLAFETDFCTELRNLKKSYASFEHAEDCKVVFNCREADEEELFEEVGNNDLSIVDLRDSHKDNKTGVLYSITAGP